MGREGRRERKRGGGGTSRASLERWGGWEGRKKREIMRGWRVCRREVEGGSKENYLGRSEKAIRGIFG